MHENCKVARTALFLLAGLRAFQHDPPGWLALGWAWGLA
jgi:hypothetical protein